MATMNLGRIVPLYKGAYAAATQYEKNDLVSYDGKIYWHRGTSPTTDVSPTDDNIWTLALEPSALPETSFLLRGDGYGGATAAVPGTDYVTPAQIQEQITNDLFWYNCADIIRANGHPADRVYNGITYTVQADGLSVKVNGTATEQSFSNYYYNAAALPDGVSAGKTYRLIHASDKVRLAIWFYKNGSYLSGTSYTTDTDVTVPADATGMLIRLQVNSGVTVDNVTVKPALLNAKSNAEITDLVNTLAASSLKAIPYQGVLANNVNVNNALDTGVYLLTGNTSTPTDYGTLINIVASAAVKVQIIFRLTGLNLYYRRYTGGAWGDWENTRFLYSKLYPMPEKKYLAFGDSLTWGALWNDASPAVTQAASGSRIPDRIANAVNCKEYTNYGVGGMAITHADGDTPKFIDWIRSKNIADADLITFMGGRNDGSAQLGTKDSTAGDGTICGGIKEIVNYIRSQNKTCQIVIIQVTPYTSENRPWTATSASGWTLNGFDEKVSAMCKELNVGYCNWYGCSLFSCWSDLSGGNNNYAHPRTADMYEQMGNFIGGQVAKWYQN